MMLIGTKNIPSKLGDVDESECPKCFNHTNWQLIIVEKYLTFFFIPVFPTGDIYSLCCEFCDHQEVVSEKEYLDYKTKLEIEQSFDSGAAKSYEKEKKLVEVNTRIQEEKEKKRIKAIQESVQWNNLVSAKSDQELRDIYFKERYNYAPSMVAAVRMELEKRKIA